MWQAICYQWKAHHKDTIPLAYLGIRLASYTYEHALVFLHLLYPLTSMPTYQVAVSNSLPHVMWQNQYHSNDKNNYLYIPINSEQLSKNLFLLYE